tara:strand:+ start:131 stop:364 length:234 start_codon:yes stop_codon:yes gene_type:complete
MKRVRRRIVLDAIIPARKIKLKWTSLSRLNRNQSAARNIRRRKNHSAADVQKEAKELLECLGIYSSALVPKQVILNS